MSAATEEVTQWVVRLSRGDQQAAQVLWERYFAKLVHYARRKLGGLPRRAADEEDAALSAMHSFYRGMAARRFAVADRDDLWKLLVTITARKACAQRRRHLAAKRGGGRVRGESVFQRADQGEDPEPGIGGVLGREPTPEFAGMVAEDCRALLDRLGDDALRNVALFTLQGYSTAEIAEKLGCVRRSVERKLERIRNMWSREAEP
jgi:DNA-directed RNA polymerase specialized sigma24 family protein